MSRFGFVCVALLIAALVAPAMGAQAQQRRSPDAPNLLRPQAAPARLGPVPVDRDFVEDKGDVYLTPSGEVRLHRVANEFAVRYKGDVAAEEGFNTLQRSLTGRSVERTASVAPSGIDIVRDPSVRKDGQAAAGTPNALSEALTGAAGVARTYPVFVAPDGVTRMVAADEILVCLKEGASTESLAPRFAAAGAVVDRRTRARDLDVYVVRLEADVKGDALTVSKKMSAWPGVAWAQPNFTRELCLSAAPNDPLFGMQQGLYNWGQNGGTANADMNWKAAWEIVQGDPSIVIAIIDDGVDTGHPDLVIAPGGYDFYNDDDDPSPVGTDGHGTGCAGVAAATVNNATNMAGVAGGCGILPIKIAEDSFATDETIGDAIRYAADHADILSNSWGGGTSSTYIDTAIDYATTSGRDGNGCPVFFATGNSASLWYQGGGRSTVSFAGVVGDYYFGFTYEKDDSVSQGLDAAWVDNVCILDADGYSRFWSQHFENLTFPPPGWTVQTNAGPGAYWTRSGTDVLTGTGGAASAKSGAISHSQYTTLRSPLRTYSGTETVAVAVACSSEAGYDALYLDLFDSDGNLAGWVPLATGVPTVTTALSYPASYANAIAVGSATDCDLRSDYSQYGTGLDFLAPSNGGWNDVVTLDPVGSVGWNDTDYKMNFGGTSSACPAAAGIAALALSADPDLTAGGVRALMRKSCDKIGRVIYSGGDAGAGGWHEMYGYGRLNALAVAASAAYERVYFNPFDTDPGWSTEGQWEFGAPQGNAGDPSSAYTGTNVYGYNLAGAYADNIPEYFLTTPALDCSLHQDVRLQYRRWLGVESATWDKARTQVSNDGTTWVDVWSNSVGSWVDPNWQLVNYDISAVADGQSTVYVRWGMGPTDGSGTYCGWNIDDFELLGVPAGRLVVAPGGDFDSAGYQGGPFTPASFDYTLTNDGTEPLTWSASHATSWLDVSSTSGALDPGADAVVTLSFNAKANLLAPGVHTGSVVFTNDVTGVSETRDVSLDVAPIPGEIEVTDSAAPADDHLVPFGVVPVGVSREEQVYIRNVSDEHPLVVNDLDITATYFEDFEDGEAQDWVPLNPAQWSVVGGEYHASTSDYSAQMQSSYPAQVWQDASVSVRMRRTGGPNATAAVFLRCSADFDYTTSVGSAYGLGIAGDGHFWVIKWVEGAMTWIQGWTDSPFLNEGETSNDVTLSIEGTAIRVYFNGNLAWTGSDGSIAGPGSIALYGFSGASDPITAHYFDDVLVQRQFEGELTVSAEQAWYNQHSLSVGDPNEAPVGLEPPEYTGVPSKPSPSDVRAASVTGTPFSITDPPVMPFSIAPGDVVTVRVACEPDRTGFVEGTLWIESNDATSPGVGVALSVKGETAVPFVSEPFDADPGWSTEGQWEFGAPQGSQGDPSSAYTGADVYGYNLDGAYGNSIPEHFLTTTAFDCTGHGNVQLQFRRWLGVESSSKDHARIQASNDGATWFDVWEHQGATLVDTDWQLVSYDISAVADGQSAVYVRWGMGPTDSAVVYGGWNIDDVALVGTPLVEDLDISPETGFDSSGYEGGPFSPASIDYTLTNEGSDPLTWTLAYTAPWLDVSSTGGTLDPGADTVVTVSLNAEADLLAPGLHTDALQFANYLSGAPQTRQVTVDVAPIPGEIQVTDSVDPADDHAVPFGLLQLHHPREEEVYVDNLSATYPLIVSDLSYAGYYLEDFEDGLAQGWTPLDAAHWSVVGGEYEAAGGDYGIVMQSNYAAQVWQDASISVQMRRTGGTGSVAAVFLRCTADFDYANDVGSAYGLGISGNGNFWLIKWVDGALTWLTGWTASPHLNTGETSNDVTLSIEGSEIRVYFNGNLAWSGSDASVPGPGSIALAGYSADSAPETIHYFDDVLVQQPMTDGMTVSAEQAWHNLRGAAGDPNVAPTMDAGAAKYDGPTSEVAPLDIRAQSLVAGPFSVPDAPALPYSISPGGRLTLTVRYDPTGAGDHEQTLRITSNDATTPEVDVALTGACYDPIQIEHTPLGAQYDEAAGYVIAATITSENELARAEVYWNADGGAYAALPMAATGGDGYEATIPAQPIGTTVGYYIECEDVEGDIVRLPWDAPATAFMFGVIGTPHLSAAPTSLSYVLAPDTQGTQAVELTNTGTGSLDWRGLSTSYVEGAGSASAFATDASSDARDGGPTPDWTKDHDADTLLVGFRKDRNVSAAAAEALHASVGATVAHRYRRIPVEVARVPEGVTPRSLASAYMASDLVAYVEPNYRLQVTKVPNDPLFGDLWGLENTGQTGGTPGADISAPSAWDMTTGSADVIVGVIDTGIDYTHPDLVGNMWVNPSPTVGDVHGARWTSGDGTMTSGDPMDDHGHGTHCSGTIAATGDNGVGVAGVNWQASLMGLKFLDSGGFGDTADAISALEYAIDHGAHLTSNSWGGAPYSAALEAMIAQAQAANQLFIAAAGNYTNDNDAVPYYPASYTNPNVISVAASDHNDAIASFSHWGATSVDLAAPGVNITSTVPGGYNAFNGTSMATPHVAGVAALALSLAPNTQWDVVKGWILDSVDVLPAWSGLTVTGGRLNAHETIIRAGVWWLSMAPDAGTLAPGESVTVQVTADATGMPDGTYEQAQLLFLGDVDGPTPVDVSLLVAGGDFVVSPPDLLAFSGPEGGPFTPESGVYTLRNLGGGPLQWTASGLPEWLDADDPLSGELPAGGTATFTVRPNALASGMPFGAYAGVLTFTEVGGAAATFNRPVALNPAAPSPAPFYTDPFDTDPGWTVEGQWEFGAPQGNDGDPAVAFTGDSVYGYNLAGAYGSSIPEYFLTTTALDCSDYSNVQLQFQRWLGVESSTWDHARIQASNDGSTWVDTWDHVGGTVADTAWQPFTYDISAVADGQSTVYVRWGMGPTDGSVEYCGWNIDDFTLLGVLSDELAVVPSTSFDSAGYEGGPFSPDSIDYTLTNRGATAVTWSLAHAAPWLDVSSAGGALVPGEHSVVTVSLNAEAEQLTPGAYADTLVFTNETSGLTQERGASLDVSPVPGRIQVTDSVDPADDHAVPFGLLQLHHQRQEEVYVDNLSATHPLIVSDIAFTGYYFEDFEDGLAQDWIPTNLPHWAVVDGEYRASAGAYDTWMYSMYPQTWEDLAVSVRIHRTGTPYSTSAVFVRCSADFDLAGSVGSAYGLGIAEGEFWVVKWVDGVSAWLTAGWTPSPYLNTGDASNDVTLSVQGSEIRVYFNGNLAWTGSDASLPDSGSIGLAGYSGSSDPITVHYFDDVLVHQPMMDGTTVSAEQAWHNLRGVPGDLGVAPTDRARAKYDGPTSDVAPLDIRAESLTAGAFSIVDPPALPYSVAPGGRLTLSVLYQPTWAGDHEERLRIVSNDATTPEVNVGLTGACYDPIQIEHTSLGTQYDEVAEYLVGARITSEQGLARAEVHWRADGGAYAALPMAVAGADWYEVVIPAQPIGTSVSYYIECEDVAGDIVRLPWEAPTTAFTFDVIGTPHLSAAPTSLSYVLAPDTQGAQFVELTNTGTGAADWRVFSSSSYSPAGGATALATSSSGDVNDRVPTPDWTREHDASTLLVGFRKDRNVTAAATEALHASLGATVAHRYRRIPVEVVRIPEGSAPESLASAYMASDLVAYVSPNYRVRADAMPDDPMFSQLWGLQNTGQTGGTAGADISAPAAWDATTGNGQVIVGVIDTGIDYTHPDLVDNMWINPSPTFGDVHGARWTNGDGTPTSGDPMDDNGHGTHCAGTIAATGDNGVGVAGVNWRARVMALKFLDASGSGSSADALSALEYAIDHGAHLTSNSYGGGGYSAADVAMIAQAQAANQLFIAAAGNDGLDNDAYPHYPSSYENGNVIAVAASDHNDGIASFSNWGATSVDLAAPGVNILSTVPSGGYEAYNGTSMSTPHVAGVAALVLSVAPDVSWDVLRGWILDSADVLPAWSGLTVTGGRLNAHETIIRAGVWWLSMAPDGGVLAPGASVQVEVTADATGMADGASEQAHLLFTGDVAGPTPVAVSLLVAGGEFVVSPADPVTFSGPEGGPFTPVSGVYTLRNLGGAALQWTASGLPDWLETDDPLSGELPIGGSTTVSLRPNALASGIPFGTYAGVLTFEEVGGASATFNREVVLEVALPAPDPFHTEPFDTDPGWAVEGQWAFGAPQGNSGDPAAAYTGDNVYGYNLAGAYGNSIPEYFLTTTALDCSDHGNVHLQFQRWLGVEDATYDGARIQVSNDGATWVDVWAHVGDTLVDGEWQFVSYDISAVADGQSTVYVRWGMGPTDGSEAYGGWNIDDVSLVGVLTDELAVVPATGLASEGLEGGPFTPASIGYTLTNRGAAAVTWSLGHAAPWLDVSSTGGVLNGGEHVVVTVSLNAGADTLTAGSYGDTLVFTNEDSGVTQERSVSLDIASAPVVAFVSGASAAGEADGTVSVDVALSLASSLSVSVDYAVTGGTATGGGVDYTLASGTLAFAPGETGKPIVVTLNDDLADEPDETVVVTLSNPVNATLGAPDSHTLTITDDDAPPQVAFARSASSAGEADGIVPVDVVLSAPSGVTVSVHYAVTGGTATGGGADYTLAPGTLEFAPGEQTKTIDVLLTEDGVLEDAETIEISLDSPVNATLGAKDRHTVTITDLAPIALSTDTAAEGMEDTAVRADADAASATRAAEVYSAMRRDNDHWLLHAVLGLADGDDIDALSIPEIDCAEPGLFASDTALYGQSYGNQDNGVTPSATPGDGGAVYERFEGVGEPITSVRWWGVTRRASDGAPEMRDPDAYRVSFHADDAGEPGAEAAVYTVTPTRSATPLMAAGCPVYAFDAELPAPVDLATGWLSIFGVDDADTEFAWAHAQDGEGDGVSHRLVGATYDIGATDMAFALGGALTAGAPPLGVHWHFSVDPAAVGVEGIAPDLHSEASNAEAAGDVFVSDGSARNALAVEEAYLGLQAVAGGEPDNIDALDMRVIPLPTSGEHLDRDAVYFSLAADSPSLVSAPGGPFAPGDLLASDGSGGFYAVATDDALGIPGEDMDALFVSGSGEAFFSVAPGGPGGYGPGDMLGADGVFGWPADGAAEVIVEAAGVGLADDDNLNGLDALARPDERFNRLVVPFFLDSAPANEAAQTAGVRTWIAVKNLSPESAPMMVQYVRANGSDITPDVYKHTLDPWQGLGWRPSVRDTGPEGEGIGAAVPDTGDGSIAGSAIVSFLEGNPMAGRLIMTSPDSQAAFTLPAVGRTTKLVVPFYLDDAAGNGQLPSVGSQTYIGVKNLSPDPVRLRITYTKPTGVDITPEDNTYILPGYAGVSWRPTVDDGFNEGVGIDVPNATGMITGSATIEATGPIAGRLVQWSAGADGFMQCAYALPDAAGSDALVSPLFLDDAPNGGLPPAAGFMSYIGVKNLLTAPQDVDVAYRSRGGADRTPASASYTWTELLGISWRPAADDGFNEGVGANVPNVTEGTEGSAVISGSGARLAGRFLASAPTDLFAHTLPSAGGSKSLVVPFFQDNASVDGELFPETGMLSLIVVRNLTDADVPITITYQDRLGDATPAANTYTVPANATVAWRPRATDAGVEGADGAAVPDSTSPITAGSAEITAETDALAGILITTSGDGASAYVLPAR